MKKNPFILFRKFSLPFYTYLLPTYRGIVLCMHDLTVEIDREKAN
jgi:hypothetical protein